MYTKTPMTNAHTPSNILRSFLIAHGVSFWLESGTDVLVTGEV
jgi:hypothetical protein